MEHKKIGIGYFTLSATYLGVGVILIKIIGSYKNLTLGTIFSDIAIIYPTLIQLIVLFSINIFLGICVFRFDKITHLLRKIVVFLGMALSFFVIVSLIYNVYNVFIKNPQDWYSWYYMIPGVLMAGLYLFYSIRLFKIMNRISSDRKAQ